MEIKTEQDAIQVFEKLVKRVLPDILLSGLQNLRAGRVVYVDSSSASRQISVQLFGSVEVLDRILMGKGITNVKVGDTAIVFSVDPKNKTQNFVIAVI
jgi:hypothetical protein